MRFQKYVCMEQRLIVNSVLDPVTGCWNWIAARDKRASTPYGKISDKGFVADNVGLPLITGLPRSESNIYRPRAARPSN